MLLKDLLLQYRCQTSVIKSVICCICNTKMSHSLAVFDFDHTIVDDNTDTAVMNLLENSQIPQKIKDLYQKDGWTAFMQGIFNLLYEHKIDQNSIDEVVRKLPSVQGIKELIIQLQHLNFDTIIISDSNSHFIDCWLKENNLIDKVLKIFTNPAEFVEGLLKIQMYHLQDDCKISTKNLCKGQILQDFIKAQSDNGITYNKVVYCGDGTNDFCPIVRLNKGDLACVRDNYRCARLIQKALNGSQVNGITYTIKADVLIWNDGQEILDRIRNA